MNNTLLAAMAVAVLISATALADHYEISVTRKGSNLYKVDGQDTYIHTRYCYEYVYYESSYLKMHGYSGEIIFLDSGETCDVKAVYGPSTQDAGTYSVRVTQEDDDWYLIEGQALFIKTSMCLSLSLGTEAVLELATANYGTMYVEGESCSVEGIYAKLRL